MRARVFSVLLGLALLVIVTALISMVLLIWGVGDPRVTMSLLLAALAMSVAALGFV
jgi:hypothetical protein